MKFLADDMDADIGEKFNEGNLSYDAALLLQIVRLLKKMQPAPAEAPKPVKKGLFR